jgi:hypothetical protein
MTNPVLGPHASCVRDALRQTSIADQDAEPICEALGREVRDGDRSQTSANSSNAPSPERLV